MRIAQRSVLSAEAVPNDRPTSQASLDARTTYIPSKVVARDLTQAQSCWWSVLRGVCVCLRAIGGHRQC